MISLPSDPGPRGSERFSLQYRLLNYCTYVLVVLLICKALFNAQSRLRGWRPSQPSLVSWSILAVVGLMLLVGLIGADSPSRFVRTTALEAFPFLAMMLLLQGHEFSFRNRSLALLVSLQALFGACIAVWALARFPVLSSRSEVNIVHWMTGGMMAPATLAVLLLPILRPWQRIAALIGYLAVVAMEFAGHGRLPVLLYVVVLPLAWMFIQARRGALAWSVMRVTIPVALVGSLGIAAAVMTPAVQVQFERGLEGTLGRLTNRRPLLSADTTSGDSEPRWIEASEFVRVAPIRTWLIGEGIGGSWRSEYMAQDVEGYRWPMVHFGPLHLVLKGGLPLLVLYHVLYAMIVVRLWRASRHDATAGAVLVYAILTYLFFLSHGPAFHRYSTYFSWTVFGIAYSSAQGSSSRLLNR